MKEIKVKLEEEQFVIKDTLNKNDVILVPVKGDKGDTGEDGYSPSATVTKVDDTATITITDKEGTTSAIVSDGIQGEQGPAGQDGFSPVVTISKEGKVTTLSITDAEGTQTSTIIDGNNGADGADGISPIANVSKLGDTATISITDSTGTTTTTITDGIDGQDGANGQDGYTPVKGVDYFTQEDIASLNIPSKTSDLDNDSNFVSSSDLATVATTGSYTDLSNKPSLFSGDYNDLTNKPTIPSKVSDLSNDTGFITNTVNNLTNYYLKSETYTKNEVNTLVSNINSFNIEIVETLPTTDIDTHTIYLVPKTGTGADIYDEYIYISNSWELIGNTAVDLSNYYTKSETNNLLGAKANSADLSTVATSGSYSDLSNKPTIPTKISDLNNDSDFIEKSNTAGLVKNDGTIDTTSYSTFSGSYTDLSNKPTIPTVNDSTITIQKNSTTVDSFTTNAGSNKSINITVPTKTSDLTNDSNFMSGMTILSYGNSTWNDFKTAYDNKHVVYCRASSNANPATGSQTRMAFMAYVNNETTPTNVEFQYVRSIASHSASQQGDQVFVYKLTNSNGGTWTVETREMSTKIVAGTNMTSSYSNGTLTLNSTGATINDSYSASTTETYSCNYINGVVGNIETLLSEV